MSPLEGKSALELLESNKVTSAEGAVWEAHNSAAARESAERVALATHARGVAAIHDAAATGRMQTSHSPPHKKRGKNKQTTII